MRNIITFSPVLRYNSRLSRLCVWPEDKPRLEKPCPDALSRLTEYVPKNVHDTLLEHQKEAVAMILGPQMNGIALLADEMGLGKTFTAYSAAVGALRRGGNHRSSKILIICPKTVRNHWHSHIEKTMATVKDPRELPETVVLHYDRLRVLLNESAEVPDFLPYDDEVAQYLHGKLPGAPKALTIPEELQSVRAIICDEAHYLKDSRTQRARAFEGLVDQLRDRLLSLQMVTGTPATDRPWDLYFQLKCLHPSVFGDAEEFAFRYCGGAKALEDLRNGAVPRGGSNGDELKSLLSSLVMIRRMKDDVQLDTCGPVSANTMSHCRELSRMPRGSKTLNKVASLSTGNAGNSSSLPPKTVNIVQVSLSEQTTATLERIRLNLKDRYKKMAARNPAIRPSWASMMLFHSGAAYRLAAIKEYFHQKVIPNLNDERSYGLPGKVILFAHHHTVLEALQKEAVKQFTSAGVVSLDGTTSAEMRKTSVDRFVNDPNCQVLVASTRVAGVGLNLFACRYAVFCEMEWSPAAMAQAIDRIHRRGQVFPVNIDILHVKGSADDMMNQVLNYKRLAAPQFISQSIPLMVASEKLTEITGGRLPSHLGQIPFDVADKRLREALLVC